MESPMRATSGDSARVTALCEGVSRVRTDFLSVTNAPVHIGSHRGCANGRLHHSADVVVARHAAVGIRGLIEMTLPIVVGPVRATINDATRITTLGVARGCVRGELHSGASAPVHVGLHVGGARRGAVQLAAKCASHQECDLHG